MTLKWAFDTLTVPRFKEQYEEFRNGTLSLNYCAGLDTVQLLAARAGVRKDR